ncbi:TPA: hypothetical protein DEF17_02040 [bacterium]|nr:MAG: hypothetical protein COS94_07260 [Candidatus Hydrogenedentes bacterium CG07_land_8_20_14_0_80_42_17]HBW46697.1 hypothetical protein [bacterium]
MLEDFRFFELMPQSRLRNIFRNTECSQGHPALFIPFDYSRPMLLSLFNISTFILNLRPHSEA